MSVTVGNNRHHGTEAEKAFLDNLGRWHQGNLLRVELLRRYVQAMDKRKDWGAVNRYEIEAYAMVLIAQEAR